ncbi:MAG: histidine kinase [Treponema sp.]|nr:histidine kinase [Treponema sp.]
MDIKRVYCKFVPLAAALLLVATAAQVFFLKYVYKYPRLPLVFDGEAALNRVFFLLNFYIPLVVYAGILAGLIFFSGFIIKGFFLIIGFSFAILPGYILPDLFIINLCLYSAYLLVTAFSFSMPVNCIIPGASILLFVLFQYHPAFLGSYPVGGSFINPELMEIIPAVVFMILLSFTAILYRLFIYKYIHASSTIEHLNYIGAKMLLFNHRLQELVKNKGGELIKQERLRFTRELHDSCGYAFTNIIAVTDAAVSCGDMGTANTQEIFQRIRKLAAEGLKETRAVVHLIREIEDPYSKSIDMIYQLKTIFEEVTGIKVEIEWGNIKNDYGQFINNVLVKIVQESFTNSIRHGHATRVSIQFWELPGSLSMTVTDNGIGASVVVKGIGLAGMEERLNSLGGDLTITSPVEGGFRLTVTIPLIDIEYPKYLES